jgi:predicted histidine transporter YuiF (NhaC family)
MKICANIAASKLRLNREMKPLHIYQLDTSEFYYLHQITASLLIAVAGMLCGVLVAWLLLGRSKKMLRQVKQENQRLQEEWVDRVDKDLNQL